MRYDGYSAYFPLWALARYRNLIASNRVQVSHGM
jgi:squalene-hopene/tetraprenyl-beta-curcumene cyclase